MEKLNTPLTQAADLIASLAHLGQKRKGGDTPYIVHPRRVAEIMASLPDANEIDIAAALLHDVIEDTSIKAARLQELLMYAPDASLIVVQAIIRLVEELTKTYEDHDRKMTRTEKREIDWQKYAAMSDRAKRIKLADRIDNLLGDASISDSWLAKYIPESERLLEICGSASPILAERLQKAIDQKKKELEK